MNPEKLFLWVWCIGLYLVLTLRLFFVSIPQMLREPDSATNGVAILAGFCWVTITLYLVMKWRQIKSKAKKGTK